MKGDYFPDQTDETSEFITEEGETLRPKTLSGKVGDLQYDSWRGFSTQADDLAQHICHHDLFPVAMDYESEFLVLECAECGERFWRNLHFLEPDLEEETE